MRKISLLLVVVLLLLFPPPHIHGEERPLMHVHFIDVGQGDSILIQTPTNKNILIDGGSPKAGKK